MALGIETGPTIQDAQKVACAVASLPVRPDILARLYLGLSVPYARRAVEDWLRACETYRGALAELRKQNIASDGLDGAEAAGILAVRWEALAAIAPPSLAIADLAAWIVELHAAAVRLLELARIAADAAALFGMAPLGNLEDIKIVLRAFALAAGAGERVIAFVTPELVARDSEEVIAARSGGHLRP